MEWKEFSDWLELDLPFGNSLTIGDILFSIVGIIATYIIAKFLVWLINQKILGRLFRKKNTDAGRQFALQHIVSYVVWSLAVFAILELLGIGNMLLASSAALLVGVGLGLQDTFKDLICGMVILVEGTTEVGDFIEVDGEVAVVTKIGLRVSKVDTRNRVNIIIPNSRLVTEKVVNWSHENSFTRFSVEVGVAFGSDLQLVQKLLLQAANEHGKVLKDPPPSVQFINFGESSLEFELFFFSQDFFLIEYVKSDLRFAIEGLLKENGIVIPFPQRELWVKNSDEENKLF